MVSPMPHKGYNGKEERDDDDNDDDVNDDDENNYNANDKWYFARKISNSTAPKIPWKLPRVENIEFFDAKKCLTSNRPSLNRSFAQFCESK